MPFGHGCPCHAIPDPSMMPERVLQAIHRPAPNIYAGALIELTRGLVPDLHPVARTSHNVAICIANGHGAWEAALTNICAAGDRILVLSTGRFAHGWVKMAARIGAEVEIPGFGTSAPVDPDRLETRLRQPDAGAASRVAACACGAAPTG